MSFVTSVFFKLPISAQEILLSVYGLYVYFQRRTGMYKSFLVEVEKNSYLDRDGIEIVKKQNTLMLLASAKYIPGYKAVLDVYDTSKREPLEFIKNFPVLEKRMLKANPKHYYNSDINSKHLLKLKTTGSTGTPLEILCTQEARKKNYAFFDWFIRLHGAKPRDKSITIAGRKIRPSNITKPPYWLLDRFNNTLYMSAYHITELNLTEYCNAIRKFEPVYIDSYPSILYEISNFAIAHNIPLPTPGFICTSSETLHPYQRKVIESAFKCPVRNQYGAAEMCVFGYECQAGQMHIREDYGLIEVVDVDKEGLRQELVCTGFINHTMPLIRYKIGDTARLEFEQKCECGSKYPVIREIEGRVDDVVISKSGRKYSRLSPILKGLPIFESQYIQESLEAITIKVVSTGGSSKQLEHEIVDRVKEYFAEEFIFKIEFVQEIPREKGGKFRSVINRCNLNEIG